MIPMDHKCFSISYTQMGIHGPHKVCTILRNEHPLVWLRKVNSMGDTTVLDWYKELTSDEVHYLNSTTNIIIDCTEYRIPLQ